MYPLGIILYQLMRVRVRKWKREVRDGFILSDLDDETVTNSIAENTS